MNNFTPNFPLYAQIVKGEKREKFELFYSLLISFNKKYNLTAITEEEEVFHKHFLDSVAGEMWIKKGANVLEVGSGAGFPSLPLKIMRDDLQFTLVESTGKKCDFLKTAVEKLDLTGVRVENARAEELAKKENYRESFDVCCARAVARLNVLAEYCLPFVKKGGMFLAYKGDAEEEVREAKRALSVLGGGEAQTHSYELPNGYGSRTLVLVKKIKNTPPAYPRGQGKERKNPLV